MAKCICCEHEGKRRANGHAMCDTCAAAVIYPRQREYARTTIQQHYGLNRRITDTEVDAELVMIRRHNLAGTLDDAMMRLYGALCVGPDNVRDQIGG